MAHISVKNLAYAIYESSKDKDEAKTDEIIKNFLSLLKQKHLLGKSDAILKELQKIIDKEGKVKRADVSMKNKLTSKMQKEIEEFIKERYKVDKVALTEKEDKSLLGGIKIEIDDEIIDTTIKNKLTRLQNYLLTN